MPKWILIAGAGLAILVIGFMLLAKLIKWAIIATVIVLAAFAVRRAFRKWRAGASGAKG